jgi:hypothetical protein
MDTVENDSPAPPEWIDALVESDADIKMGRTVPLEPVLARMQASVDRMEARRPAQVKMSARGE